MRRVLAGTLGLSLALLAAEAHGEEFQWRPCGEAASPKSSAVTLGRPIALPSPTRDAEQPTASSRLVVRAQSVDPGAPGAAWPPPTRPAAPTNPSEQFNCGVATDNPSRGFVDRVRGIFTTNPFDSGAGHHLFESDHAFDGFISPVSNPFYFEDPRALTEIRPILLFQQSSSQNPVFHSHDIEFFGVQARLAVTQRLSFVMSKFGWIWADVNDPADNLHGHSSFTDIILGPKYTFLRCDGSGTLGAAGLNFDIPAGSSGLAQNTGSASVEPYVSFGQSFGSTSYGTFHALATFGYNFSVDNERSDSLFLSTHLDFDVGNLHKIYPFLELNWFYVTTNGTSRNLNFEGYDLFNFGSRHVAGQDEVTLAVGARYKISECIQFGLAADFRVTGQRDVESFRVLFDVIFRY
jgi:hypothetical protein